MICNPRVPYGSVPLRSTECRKLLMCSISCCPEALRVKVGHFRLPLPLAFFYRCSLLFFFPQSVFPWESLHKTLIKTIFCVQLSQFEFPHAYALLPHPLPPPNSHLNPPGRCPISASHFSIKFARHCSGKSHCTGEMKVSTSTVAALFSKMALTGQRIAMVDMVLLVFPAFPYLP